MFDSLIYWFKTKVYMHYFNDGYNRGVNDTLSEIAAIARDAKYPEYLEEDLIEFLNDKGVKV